MLSIAKEKAASLSDYISDLRILPISISYEYDPCDAMKARELRLLEEEGVYKKEQHEDLISIGKGISGYKGRVHLQFGSPLVAHFESVDEAAAMLDEVIVSNYKLFPSNLIAYSKFCEAQGEQRHSAFENLIKDTISDKEISFFEDRLNNIEELDREHFIKMYANPVINILNRQYS